MSRSALVAVVIALAVIAPRAIAQNNAESFVGIGMAFDRSPERWIRVGGVLPDGPAQRAGIVAGDLVLSIDGVDVRNLGDEQVPQKIRGAHGTEVTLVVFSNGQQQPREIKVRREVIPPRQPVIAAPAPPAQPRRPANPLERKETPAPPATGVQIFSLMTIKDPQVNDAPAVQVMVPQGWQADGRIVWMPDYSIASNLQLLVRDPKTGVSIQWLPAQSFTFMPQAPMPMKAGTNYMGRVWMQPIGDPAQFVRWFYGQTLPHLRDAKLVGGEDFPSQAKYYLAQMTAPGEKQIRTVRLRYEFTGRDGQPWEEDVFFTLAYNSTQMMTMWDVFAATSVRGPKGSLNQMRGVTQAVLNSLQFTPQWLATRNVVQQLFTEGLRKALADQRALGRKLAEYREHISKLSQQIHEDRMKSMDARNEAFREVLGGVENYKDPFQHQAVYLPAGYKEYWANPKGEYILSEQIGYNPNIGETTEWRKIERIDPMRR